MRDSSVIRSNDNAANAHAEIWRHLEGATPTFGSSDPIVSFVLPEFQTTVDDMLRQLANCCPLDGGGQVLNSHICHDLSPH